MAHEVANLTSIFGGAASSAAHMGAAAAVLNALQAGAPGLVLITGGTSDERAGVMRMVANALGRPITNLSIRLAEELLDVPPARRPISAARKLPQLIAGTDRGVCLLDDLEFTFAPVLQLDPVHALRLAARSRQLVAVWPGSVSDGRLTYAREGHPEWRSFEVGTETIVDLNPASELAGRRRTREDE